jgi:hypothetical protein
LPARPSRTIAIARAEPRPRPKALLLLGLNFPVDFFAVVVSSYLWLVFLLPAGFLLAAPGRTPRWRCSTTASRPSTGPTGLPSTSAASFIEAT